jgi:hypothetical protein
MQPLHDRMPVILDEKDWPAWLGEVETSFEDLKKLLVPFPSEEMHLWPVDKRVGNVRNDLPNLRRDRTRDRLRIPVLQPNRRDAPRPSLDSTFDRLSADLHVFHILLLFA